MNKHRFAFLTIATILGLTTVFAFATVASAQGAGIYELVGSTSQGEGLELVVTPGSDLFTVTSVRLSGAVVRCAKSYQDLDLGAIVFPANTQIKTSSPPPPFTISRLLTDDAQVPSPRPRHERLQLQVRHGVLEPFVLCRTRTTRFHRRTVHRGAPETSNSSPSTEGARPFPRSPAIW